MNDWKKKQIILFPGKLEDESILLSIKHSSLFTYLTLILFVFINLAILFTITLLLIKYNDRQLDQKLIYNIIFTTSWLLSAKLFILVYVKYQATRLIITNERIIYIKFNFIDYQPIILLLEEIKNIKINNNHNLILEDCNSQKLIIENIANTIYIAKLINQLIEQNYIKEKSTKDNLEKNSLNLSKWLRLEEGKFSRLLTK